MTTEERFKNLWEACQGYGSYEFAYEELVNAYSQPHRHYHTMKHVVDCLSELDQERAMIRLPLETELALWYHDLVYDPMSKTNEVTSWNKLDNIIYAFCLDRVINPYVVKEMILATDHQVVPRSLDAKYVVDIDLAILGRSPQVFAEYEDGIRMEYSAVSDSAFYAARRKFLDKLKLRDHIYNTDHFRWKYEELARMNLR